MTDHNDKSLSVPAENRLLTRAEFQGLAAVPAELEWFANIDNASFLTGTFPHFGQSGRPR